jgi:hypothetical protein
MPGTLTPRNPATMGAGVLQSNGFWHDAVDGGGSKTPMLRVPRADSDVDAEVGVGHS